jgi:thioredoxin reductase/Pyruvate/2-oxoacid:ferredoxin oxidoreductase delta subunit
MKMLSHFLNSLIKMSTEHFEIVVLGIFGLLVWKYNNSKKIKHEQEAKKKLKKSKVTNTIEPLTLHPEIDSNLCAGCGGCTRVCPEGDILKLIDNKAVLVTPSKCVGHGQCEAACPMDAIKLVFGTKTKGMNIPRLTTNYETNVPGVYIAGELGGMGLIRNAVKQGWLATDHAINNIKTNAKTDYDLVIVGAGPAGLSASLTAISKKKSYLLIEQNTFGGTVYNFPRQKIVMSKPAELPMVGPMNFPNNKVSKEDLLHFWNKLRIQYNIQIKEKCKFEKLKPLSNSTFEITTNAGTFTTKKVILSMGVRGTPRRLGLRNEDLPKVTYNLIDPNQYQNNTLAIVGGGNAAVEAAQMLAKSELKNDVTLLVRGSTFDRCDEENQDLILKLKDKGLIKILFNTSVTEISTETIVISKDGQSFEIPNQYLFVFAGAQIPAKFLMSLGINIDKKFGEGLKRAA